MCAYMHITHQSRVCYDVIHTTTSITKALWWAARAGTWLLFHIDVWVRTRAMWPCGRARASVCVCAICYACVWVSEWATNLNYCMHAQGCTGVSFPVPPRCGGGGVYHWFKAPLLSPRFLIDFFGLALLYACAWVSECVCVRLCWHAHTVAVLNFDIILSNRYVLCCELVLFVVVFTIILFVWLLVLFCYHNLCSAAYSTTLWRIFNDLNMKLYLPSHVLNCG